MDQSLDVAHHLHELELELLLGQGLRRTVAVLEHPVDRRHDTRDVLGAGDLRVVETGELVRAEPLALVQDLVGEEDVRFVSGMVAPRIGEVERHRDVRAPQDDVVPVLPVELLFELLARDEGVAVGPPLFLDGGIDRRIVEDLGEVDLRVAGELSEEVLRTVVLVDAAEPDLRRGRDDARDLLDPLSLRESEKVPQTGRVLDDDAVGALPAGRVLLHRAQQRDEDHDQHEHEDDRGGRQDRAGLLAEDVAPDQAEILHSRPRCRPMSVPVSVSSSEWRIPLSR